MRESTVCRIPVQAKGSGTPVMTKTEYAVIPASGIARFLLEKFGADAIFDGGEGGTHLMNGFVNKKSHRMQKKGGQRYFCPPWRFS